MSTSVVGKVESLCPECGERVTVWKRVCFGPRPHNEYRCFYCGWQGERPPSRVVDDEPEDRSPAHSVKDRDDGTWERSKRGGPLKLYRRLRLRRGDGRIYLDRWGLAHDRIGGILLHRMSAPDPGVDLHDHPWWFLTIPLWGGYLEERALARNAPMYAEIAERVGQPATCRRGVLEVRKPFRPRIMRLDECHTIVALRPNRPGRRRSGSTSWSLVIRGPRVRKWGFFLPTGWVDEHTYDTTVRAGRRDLWGEIGASGDRPW